MCVIGILKYFRPWTRAHNSHRFEAGAKTPLQLFNARIKQGSLDAIPQNVYLRQYKLSSLYI